jgi:G3E family GTPase
MLPICLVTGFLGTGKTTLLKNIVAKNRDRKMVYLINEFSAHDVDGAIVSAENPDVVSIPGGSIFCHCLVTEFIGQLKKVAEEMGGFDGVVIEASGMANPKVIEQMLAETKLDRSFRLATIISVLDPGSFLKLRRTLPNILAQVEAADVVLVNKTDCNPPEKIEETLAAVQELNPAADCIQTVQCNVELDLFAEHAPRGLQGEYAKCRDPNYETFVTEQPFDGDRLETFVREKAADIYRVKGTLSDEFFDCSTAGVTRTPQPGAEPALAWIVKGGTQELIRNALDESGV